MPSRALILASRTIYDGKIVRLRVERVVEPGGVRATREVVYHGASVVVLAEFADGRLLLVRQYRFPARQSLWELVAGGIEPGETLEEAARRELREETGYRARTVKFLADFYPSPGFLSERMYLVEARGLTRAQACPETDERIRASAFTRQQLARLLRQRKIRDGKTLAGLLWVFGGWRRRRKGPRQGVKPT